MMPETLERGLTLVAVVGAGLVGGVFLAFSTFVMSGLGRAPDAVGLRSMQEINRQAPTPVFMTLLLGTALVCLALAVSAATELGRPAARLLLAGCLAYLLSVVVTAAYHVPRNDALALLDPASASSTAPWRDYLAGWTAMNHVRTLAAGGGTLLLTLAHRVG